MEVFIGLVVVFVVLLFVLKLVEGVLKSVANMHKSARVIKNTVVTWHGREYRRSK